MKMTKEQVEQARQLIWTCARTNNPSKAELRICFRELDTLCAAAREPESLVGKKVRVKASLGDIGFGNQMTISCGPLWLGESTKRAITLNRDDFELLEDDNAG